LIYVNMRMFRCQSQNLKGKKNNVKWMLNFTFLKYHGVYLSAPFIEIYVYAQVCQHKVSS